MSVHWNRSYRLPPLILLLFACIVLGTHNVCVAQSLAVASVAGLAEPFRIWGRGVLWAGAGVALGAAGAAWWVSRRAARRVRGLTEFSRAVTAGRVPPPLRADREDLLGALERNMVSMAAGVSLRLEGAREEQRKLEAILSGMGEGLLVVDASGIIRLSNDRAARMFDGGGGATLVGEPLLKVSRDPDLQALFQEVSHGEPGRRLLREITINGERLQSFRVSAAPVEQPAGQPALFILVFHDVTELKKLEQVRRDFVANVSHEIRTPLTAIRGYAETLREGTIDHPELASRFVDVIARHAERLTRLTDDLLILSDLEMGNALLRRVPVPLAPTVQAAIDVLRPKAEQREVEIRWELPANLPPLHADPDRLEQVLVNLIDNAVKYTSAGGHVRVSARPAPSPHANTPAPPDSAALCDWVEINVTDTGIGIPSQDLPRLTERFYRVDKARSRELGGTGLGLAIVKHIVLAHGGALRIESELGQGTRVSVCLPTASAGASGSAQEPPTRMTA